MLPTILALLLALTPPGGPAGDEEPDEILKHVNESWTGDLDGMVERGFVRVLTVHNPVFFTFDGADHRGLATEMGRRLEEHLAQEIGQTRSPTVIMIPVARDELIPGLLEGRGDIAAANLTITPARERVVAFSPPLYPGISELVVTGPAAAKVSTFDDLTVVGLQLRHSSSYFEHMLKLNAERRKAGKKPIPVRKADENLEDHDLLDMVNAGVIPAIVVDSHKAKLWAQVFEKIRVHDDLAIHTGNEVGWAFRKGSPQLTASLDTFARSVRKGTLLGNMAINRYLKDADWMDEALSSKHRKRFEETARLIQRYAAEYDFDWLMIAAQAFQESRFDQSKRSASGAVGIMQILPSTAADPAVGISDISTAENNIAAGVKYLRHLRDQYFSSEEIAPLDQLLLSLAAYNAGPGNVARARRKAAQLGFDPNRWFGHVEIGMFRSVSGEPVSYVRNIYKYYVTYQGLEETRQGREEALRGGR